MKIGEFKLEATDGAARAGVLQTAHGPIQTPVFMPVGTKASVKSLDPTVLTSLGAQIVLGNTYHLYLAPNDERIAKLGGLHQFMQWNKPILTDSGGFQVFSLGLGKKERSSSSLSFHGADATVESFKERSHVPLSGTGMTDVIIPEARITDDGVEFRSHKDGSKHFFTPEKSIEIQANLGADIIMAFDECPPNPSTPEYLREALNRTHAWLDRSIDHKKTLETRHSGERSDARIDQNDSGRGQNDGTRIATTHPQDQLLFGIVQGGTNKAMREESALFVSSKDLPGIAIGGIAVGEAREAQLEQVEWVMPHLPVDKPHYLMGVGTPLDLVEFVARGIDMFDCVLPTRLARNGAAWVVEPISSRHSGEQSEARIGKGSWTSQDDRLKGMRIQIKNASFADDPAVLDSSCSCSTCARFSRAYLHHLFMENEPLGMQLLSIHNLHVLIDEMRQIREHIITGTFAQFHNSMCQIWQD